MAATEKQWFVGEDGCISVGEPTRSVTYHSALNTIIVSTRDPSVKIYDVASGVILQKSDLSANGSESVRCTYLPESGRIIFADEFCIGVRSDLKGMLLLDTALQSPVKKNDEKVKIEIPLAEASHLLKSLTCAELPGVDHVDEVVKELEKGIEVSQEATKGSLKVSKWATVCIEIQHGILKDVCSDLVTEMKKLSLYNPGLSAASAVNDRLSYLLNSGMTEPSNTTVDRQMMYSEAARKETFRKWPHMNYKWALPDPMSQAGFYHQPNSVGDDRAMCFTCNVCLVCWEPTDEPWSEHERHSPACPFVKGEYTHNVPLCVTYASQPAKRHGDRKDKIECVSSTTCDDFVATSTLHGNIVVWNARNILKRYCQFNIDPTEIFSALSMRNGIQIDKETGVTSPEGAEGLHEDETDAMVCEVGEADATEMYEIPIHNGEKQAEPTKTQSRPCEDIMVKSLCVVRKPFDEKEAMEKNCAVKPNRRIKSPQPTLICGASLRCQKMSNLRKCNGSVDRCDTEEVHIMNQVNEVVSSPRIIEVENGTNGVEEDLMNTSSFIPHILVLAVKDTKRKSVKSKEKRIVHRVSSLTNNNVPSLGSLTMNHDFGLLDPMFEDPDVQIVGVTPGPSVSTPGDDNTSKSVSDAEKSETKLSSSQSEITISTSSAGKQSTKVKAGTILQYIELPQVLQRSDLEVGFIVPTLDKLHVIVIVIPKKQFQSVICNSVPCTGARSGGALLLYRYKFIDEYASLEEKPVLCKLIDSMDDAVTSITVLPSDVCDPQEEEEDGHLQVPNSMYSKSCEGLVVVTRSCGKFWLMNVCDLGILAEVCPPENDRFISTTYCSGIERLCLCTENGKLHFYQLSEQSPVQIELTADSPDGLCNGDLCHEVNDTKPEVKEKKTKKHSGSDILAKQPLSVENLVVLHNLIQFENLMPRFTATVPSCWAEIQQEQQQRRHPQHLQHQGEATQHTRTWKLQPDSGTWDEHIFEIVLTKPCCVGHVDVKFSLNPLCTTCPDVQITLLKQNITSIGRQSNSGTEVDQVIDFGIKTDSNSSSSASLNQMEKGQECENSVLDPQFLESHNAEILCGPVSLSSCLDLSGTGGLITLTSPQLMSCKPKAFLVHLKGFPKAEETSAAELSKEAKKKSSSQVSSRKIKILKKAFDNDLFVPPSAVKEPSSVPRMKYMDNLKGCDWISEISLTIRKTKKTQLCKERVQRIAMVDNQKFHDKLLDGASFTEKFVFNGVSADHWQNMIMDILLWITAVQMNDPNKGNINKSLTLTVQKRLPELVRACFIQGSRTIAHKCSRLVALCMEHCKLSPDQDLAPAFSFNLLQALMENLQLIPSAQSSGAIRWFFTLLNRVKCMDVVSVAWSCTDLLLQMSKHCFERTSPLHSLLKSRYGLYGQPFDNDLFDSELPVSLKQSNPSTTYASALSNNMGSSGITNSNTNSGGTYIEEIDFYDLFNPPSDKSSKVQLEYAKSNVFGMLEVEPLHFTCHATSDGTKMEKLDHQGHSSVASNASSLGGTINFGEWNPLPSASAATSANLSSLSSKMAVTKQHLQELSNKTYPMFKHKIMHIKQILSEVGKSLPAGEKYNSDQLLPPTPKSTPQVITPPLTPPNEYFQSQSSMNKTDKLFPSKSNIGMQNVQTLLQQPPLQALVIERMHSGARRFVILDFGKPIVLTDVVIPACADLASLSIDVWVQGEEIDGQRFVVATDIGTKSLIMNDIAPTLVCRYLKITTIGRYGSGSARSKIPIGSFYGHGYILPWEWNSYMEQRTSASLSTCSSCSSSNTSQIELTTQSQLIAQLDVYVSLLEDIQCRYSLVRTRLENMLRSVDSQHYASSHIQYFLKKSRKNNDEDNKILQAYNDCLQLQLQQNLAQRVIDRLQSAIGVKTPKLDYGASLGVRLRHACTDKLRFLKERLLDTLLSMTTCTPSIPLPPQSLYTILSPQTAQTLFKHLCVHGNKKSQISAGVLLMRVCGTQPWWGNFFGNVLQEFFHSENVQIFPQDRVFVLLVAMGQKSLAGPCAVTILESLLDMLAKVLSPVVNGQPAANQTGLIDLTLVSWILLFLCRNLEHTNFSPDEKGASTKPGQGLPNRWNFIQGDHSNGSNRSKSKSAKVYRWSMHKRLQHHKKKLMDLEQAQKTFFSSQMEAPSPSGTNTLLKQQEKQFRKELSQYATKHLKDVIQMRRNDAEVLRKLNKGSENGGSGKGGDDDDTPGNLVLSKEKTLRVVGGLMALLLNMDFTCNVDLFLVTCKVLATICVMTRPAVSLSEAMTQEQLEKMILLASNLDLNYGSVSWGGPWARHSITCLLQDILDGEKYYPGNTQADIVDDLVSNITEESLHHSGSLPSMSTLDDPDQDQSSGENNDIESDYKDESKMSFDKESSLMVDLLLDESEYDDDTSVKLHEYVTGETLKQTPPHYNMYDMTAATQNGTIEYAQGSIISSEADKTKIILKKYSDKEKADQIIGMGSNSGSPLKSIAPPQGMSTATDARLELGLETQAELKLKVMVSLHTENVQQAFAYALPTNVPVNSHPDVYPSTEEEYADSNVFVSQQVTSSEMLSKCYEHLCRQLVPNRNHLDALLQLWVTLNSDGGPDSMTFDPTKTPFIPLSEAAVANLLNVVAATPSIQLSTWVLVFQTLSLLANQKVSSPSGDISMVVAMIADSNLISAIMKFLSGTSEHGPLASAVQYTQVGPSATKYFYEFLMRLLIRCPPDSLGRLHEIMLKLVYTLTAERGAFHCGLGPLDAQCKFMEVILEISFEQVDISNAISVIESISTLVHQHLMTQERVTCKSSSEQSINSRSCFGGMFASLLRGGDSKSVMGDASRDLLMCSLLKLVNSLIQIKCGTRQNQTTNHDVSSEPRAAANISLSEPVTDATKLSQGLVSSAPPAAMVTSAPLHTMSDDDKSQQTDEQKTENLNNGPADPVFIYLTDIILGHQQIMSNLIQALSYCNSNTMAAILGSREISSHMQETFTGVDPVSVGDMIYQILVTLLRHCTEQKLVLESLLHYISGSCLGLSGGAFCRLSEPLLWFALRILDSPKAIHQFHDMSGIEVVCQNLVNCNSFIINTSPSLISTIMQNLNGKIRSSDKRTDTEYGDGLQNFAPLGTISSSSPSASPAEVLIQAAPPHRRARSAAWSYHFYPDEAWVDLTIQLPFAVLLSDVQIQPHSASLTTCPAYVSLEISHDGVTNTPQCQPLMTSSLAFIKLSLQRPQVASIVTIRLHKARDSMTIGLSQVMLMGYSAFGYTGSSTQNILLPTVDFISQSSVRWTRLLHHCLTAHKDVEDLVAASAASTPGLLSTCSALLVSSVSASSVYYYNIEAVLLKLGLHSLQMGLAFIDNILRSPTNQLQRGQRTPFMGKISGQANDSTVEILYQLGITQDTGTSKRVQALLNWLGDSARVALQKTASYSSDGYSRIPHQTNFMSLPSPAPAHIHCVAVILWQSHQLPVEYNLGVLITKDLVSSLYEWSITLESDSSLKRAVDHVLCAICHISPEFFTQILTWVGIKFSTERNGLTESVSDDIKDSSHPYSESMTDDSKEASGQNRPQENHYLDFPTMYLKEFRHICLEETHLATLANSCKSPMAIRQLLDSGFPAVLAQGLFEFCNKMISRFTDGCVNTEGLTDTSKTINDESVSGGVAASRSSSGASLDKSLWITADLVGAVLHFFAELSTEPLMKDWLGEAEGNIFWPSLLTLLCNAPLQSAAISPQGVNKTEPMTVEDRTSIETEAVHFFNRVISCHMINQLLFAKVMCEVIKDQSIGPKNGPSSGNFPLSGFARCLFLQVLLEDEKILVSLTLENQQQKIQTCKNAMPMEHPKLCGGRCCQCVVVSLHTTCSEILQKLSESYSLSGHFMNGPSEKPSNDIKDLGRITSEFTDISSSVVSGMVAKEKREKEDKSSSKTLPPRPPTRRKRHNTTFAADAVSSQLQPPNYTLYHPLLPNKPLPGDLTLSQLLQVLHQRGLQHGNSLLEFIVKLEYRNTADESCNQPDDWSEVDDEEDQEMSRTLLLSTPSFPSALQIFASVGGLALLAEHLPLLYDPDLIRQPVAEGQGDKVVCRTLGTDGWVTVDPFPEEFYELCNEDLPPAPPVPRAANSSMSLPTIPPHSLIAFGLFLRLPGYAEVLLKERKKAQCLLRLVLGVTDDGDGGYILSSPIASSLPTLPFLVLKSLYDNTPLTTDDGVLLRRMSLEIWAIHLILACLSVLSHHLPRVSMPGFQQEAQLILSAMQTATTTTTTTASSQPEEKSQQYWAKGTGFGTGSTTSSWDAEQALLRQKQEEEHVACLLQVLASYVNPGGEVPSDFESSSYTCPSEKMLLPDMIPELLSQSCLIPAISSYLRNDSVLDMARHIPMYRALLELLRGIAVCPSLVPLLLPLDKDNNQDSAAASIGVLLEKMRKCVDTYASRLKSNKGKNGQNGTEQAGVNIGVNVLNTEEEEENEGLALLIPNIQETARIVKISTDRLQQASGADHKKTEDSDSDASSAAMKHDDEKYMATMKPLQFDVFQIVEDENNGLKFNCRHHYENNIRTAGDNSNPARTRRLAQEAVTLSTSLPLSAGSSVFVRCDEERLDVMKVLITGPSETPYANGCFEFDVYFPQDYPNSPPFINLATTGNHTVRFNPNLYNDGKVCLSVLNTWHGRPEEKWNSQTSSFLQVLVSIQSLILVAEPYFNEPGYERSRGTPSGTANSREYDANIRQATVKWAMLEQLRNPCPSLKDIIQRHFWIKRREILKQCEEWITEMEGYSTDKRTGRTIAHSTMALKRYYNQLREELSKMKPPEGLEEECDSIDIQEKVYSTESSMNTSLCDMPGTEGSIMDTNSNTIVEDVVEIL